MLVRTQLKGHAYLGVEIGTTDVRRYFPKQIRVIEIELDHLQIRCGLAPAFWNGRPEISDRRLSAWLEAKNFNGKLGEKPIPLALIPSGRNCFRLQAIPMSTPCAQARPKPAAAPVHPA